MIELCTPGSEVKIVSLNLNGIRAAARRGFIEWLQSCDAEYVCVQELRAQPADLSAVPAFTLPGWNAYFNCADRKGYAGVGIYSRRHPDAVLDTLDSCEFDSEGRYIELRFGILSVVSLYLPSGSAGPERQASKDRFLEFFYPKLDEWAHSGRHYIVCGDWNIAHTKLDLKNWRSNQKNSGFLPHERSWLTRVINELSFVDAWRHLHPDSEDDGYTWWSNRGRAYEKNVGWRIDYQLVTADLTATLKTATVYKKQRFSDHAPLIVEYGTRAFEEQQ